MAETVGSVAQLWRYPVKSLQGERVSQFMLTPRGVPGDRCWAVRDEERGGIRGAKRFAKLMQLAARFDHPPQAEGSSAAVVRFPDGEEFTTADPALADRLCEFLGAHVTFWPLLPKEKLEHYRRGAPVHEDLERELRRVFARKEDEPLPDLSVFPDDVLQYESPPGTYFDAFPLLLLSDRSLETLQRQGEDSRFDVRRFRPNLLLTDCAADEPFPEFGWAGRQLQVGAARLHVEIACPRCVMTTHDFADLPRDPEIMRTLVREAGGNLGVYASVEEPGEVAEGDAVRLL